MNPWMAFCAFAAGALVLMMGTVRAEAPEKAARIKLRPVQGKMVANVRVPGLAGQSFHLGMPETIGCRERMILNFPEVDIRWDGPDEAGAVRCTWTTAGRIRYSAKLIPAVDYVDVEMTIENLGKTVWHDVFAFNCVNPTGAPKFKDWQLERTYMSVHGRPFLMNGAPRVKGHMPTVQFFLHQQIPWGNESPFVRGFGATSPTRPDDSWIVTLSDPPGSYMAATSVDSLFLFDNLDRCCIHSAPSFGDIAPGKSSTTVCRQYFAKGGLEDFLNRYQADRVGLAASQKWARPGRPRIELRGIEPPGKGKFGRLGFEVRAPWMTGHLQMRFPETLHTSLGLHFIDHDRRDMPPLYMLEPFPKWQLDPATGEVSYRYVAKDGVEFGGRARPYEDEVFLEYRIKNNSDKLLHRVFAQMCLSLRPGDEFNTQNDVADTYAWFDSKWTSLAKTTPTAQEKGRKPWLQILTRKARKYRGKRDNKDGWWFVDQLADEGVIARASKDAKHLVAIAWEGATVISTNSRIPCLHAGPGGGVRLKPGQEVVWHGKIYLMKNDPKALLVRHTGDGGKWPYPDQPRKRPRLKQPGSRPAGSR